MHLPVVGHAVAQVQAQGAVDGHLPQYVPGCDKAAQCSHIANVPSTLLR
jgi:hypothetical protein